VILYVAMAQAGDASMQPKVHPMTDVESGGEEGGLGGEGGEGEHGGGVCEHKHYSHRAPWLRALVLGANDGLVSIASLMLGVGAVEESVKTMVVSGLAGLVAGACSMAIGEFVSVHSQRDAEKADVEKERQVGGCLHVTSITLSHCNCLCATV
jgi:VIT1/CCC1 family predicted Fe2+/Mn2+ transporter